jgi:flavin reductase (DIM6/NTAB) family NADH-FMN oxidoreductase RutF
MDADNTEMLKMIMRNWTSGVGVVTSANQGEHSGTTISSFASVSLDPPLVLFNLTGENATRTMIEQSGRFGVSMLAYDQRDLSEIFAGFGRRVEDRFAGLQTFTLKSDVPMLPDALAWLDCEVYQIVPLPDSSLIIGKVLEGKLGQYRCPLVYHNRAYVDIINDSMCKGKIKLS